jgi:hypothetical protein
LYFELCALSLLGCKNFAISELIRSSKFKVPSSKYKGEVKIVGIILGIVIGAIGGVILYRVLFLEPSSAVVITETEVRQLPNTARVLGGIALLVIGVVVAFLSARKRNS